MRGPFTTRDLRSAADAPPLDAAGLPHVELRKRACTRALSLPQDHPDRRPIEYIVWRLRDNDAQAGMLAARLHDLTRNRKPGAFA